jgi:MFS family permease
MSVKASNKTQGRVRGVASRIGLAGLPLQVYVLLVVGLVFSFGRALAYPYIAMYMSGKGATGGLEIDASLVGFMLMVGGFAYIFALLVTGNLCDRFGRRKLMLLFVISQVFLTLGYAYARGFGEFLALYLAGSVLGACYDPAHSAMIADLVSPERREEVYGLSYMISNIGVVFSPPIGGLLASASGFPILFVYATVFMAVGAVVVFFLVRESYSEGEQAHVSLGQLSSVFRDRVFILFCFLGAMTNLVYSQLYGLLSVYTDHIGLPPYAFGILFSVNGAMVVALQVPIRKAAMRIGSAKTFIVAQLLFAAGFAYFTFSREFVQFLTGVIVLTLGEITFMPASSGFTANLSPVDMRGRYQATSGLFLGTGGSIGTLIGFRLYDVLANKEFIWAVLGGIGFATLPGYVYLLRIVKGRERAEGKPVTSIRRPHDKTARPQLVRTQMLPQERK